MLSPFDFFLVVLFICFILFVADSLKLREKANQIARHHCKARNVQFLDGSVGFGTLGLARDSGTWGIRRVYVFDYSEDVSSRRQAAIIFIHGRFYTLVLLDAKDDEVMH